MKESFGTLPANVWRAAYLRNLRRRTSREVARRTSRSAIEIFELRKNSAVDRQGLTIVAASALLVAAYRELLATGQSSADAYETVRRSAHETFGTPTRVGIRALMDSGRDSSRRMAWAFGLLARKFFGAGVVMERKDAADHTDFIVTKCAFNDFFANTEEPLLGRIICEWDKNWMEPANRTGRMRAVRPNTLSTGTGPCAFVLGTNEMSYSGPIDIVREQHPDVASVLENPN